MLLISATNPAIKIKEAKISFELPNDKWKQVDKQNKGDVAAYIYKREPIVNAAGTQVIPNIAIIVEPVDKDANVLLYSMQKRQAAPCDVKQVYVYKDSTGNLNYANAVAYRGTYTDKTKDDHTVYLVHLINGKKGVQVVMDITSDLVPAYENEFLSVMRSIQ